MTKQVQTDSTGSVLLHDLARGPLPNSSNAARKGREGAEHRHSGRGVSPKFLFCERLPSSARAIPPLAPSATIYGSRARI